MISKGEQLSEFARCLVDIPYAIKTYLETFDQTQEKYVPFNLFSRQIEVINAFESNRFILVSKYRQAGMTTTLSAFFAIKTSFHGNPERPEKILILANKQETAQEVLQKVKEFLNQIPRWVWGQEYVDDITKTIYLTDSKKHLVLPNKCQIKALATSKDALRGYTPTILMMDEAAHIDDGAETFGAALAAMSTGGKIILNSTPNGLDPLYYKVYDNARTGKNKFKVVQMYWYEDPRYNKNLKWLKDGLEPILEKEYTIESFKRMIDDGYKPTSDWYEEMCSNYNGNTKLIAQELDCSFIGSGGNVIDEEHIEYHEKENVKFPIRFEGAGEECWIWQEPIQGHKYIMGVDVSRGDSEDFSVIEIIDTDTMEQVLEWVGKIQPDLLAELVYDYGNRYNAYTVVDITGGMGVTTVLKLLEMDYKLLHFDDPRSRILSNRKDISKFKSIENKVPGFNVGAYRLNMVAELEKAVRTGEFKIRSHRVISEMKTFIYINGRPDHMKGYHDDCLKEGTLIKTIDGYKEIENIIPGDLVLTHLGNYKPVEIVLKKPFNGEWFDFKFSGQVNLGLSYNHPLYSAEKTDNRRTEEQKNERSWLFPQQWLDIKNKYKDGNYLPRQISIIESLEENQNVTIKFEDLFKQQKNENIKLKEIILDSNFSKFLGLFLADGHSVKHKLNKEKKYTVQISFHQRDVELIEEIKNYINSFDIKCQIKKGNGKCFTLTFSNKLIWGLLNQCYDDKKEKILPPYSKYLGKDLKYVLEYWLKGDGWKDNRKNYDLIGASTSKKLILSMRDIAWSLGYYGQIREIKRKRYDVETKSQYWLHLRKSLKLGDNLKKLSDFEYGTKTVKIKKSQYNGDVYNLQVADDNSFIANGIVVHNCIMSIAMCLFVLQHSFKNLEKVNSQTKAMLNSWVSSTPSTSGTFIQSRENTQSNEPAPQINVRSNLPNDYQQYNWLFGGSR